MSTALHLRSAPPRDWLFLGSGSHYSKGQDSKGQDSKGQDSKGQDSKGQDSARAPGRTASYRLTQSRALLRICRHQNANLLHHARIIGGKAASFLRTAGKHFAVRCVSALGRVDPTGIGEQIQRSWRWSRGRAAPLLLAHPWAAGSAFALLLPFGYLAYCIATLPLGGGLVIEPTPSALVVEAEAGQVFATRGVFKGARLAPQDVPLDLSRAIIAIEDRHFYEHGGFYLPSMLRASLRNLLSGSAREGGSTITQQLARMMYLSPERTIKRKVQEAVLTLWLEHHLDKPEILTRYLNTAYFGAGVYGVDAAAKRYFGKAAKELSLGEAAMLAGLVRAPSTLAPNRNLEGARARAALVLDAMVGTGAISAAQAEAARRAPASLRVPPDNPPGTNYFVDMLAGDVKRLVGSPSADLTLRSTLDLNLQSIAESVIARRLKAEGRAKKVGQAALVAMAPDGAVLAMVGGVDYNESQFNRATQAKRQPGSLFKIFVYLAALEKGFRPDMMAVDRPVAIGDWEPENYGGRFRGPVTLRTAFASSINSVAVQLSDAVGIPAVIDTARKLGVQSQLPAVPSIALGSAEVTLMEMTRAFAAIAANAENIEPYAIRSIQKGDQVVFARPKSAIPPARDQAARAAIRDLLAGVVREGTGKAARIDNTVAGKTGTSQEPVAGKTGTSQEHRDAWFIGFTRDIVVGVWVGNDDNSPTRNVTGGDIPARIWNEFVTQSTTARAKSARLPAVTTGIATNGEGLNPKPEPSAVAIRGVPNIQNTGLIEVDRRVVRLFGVEGVRGRAVRDFRRYLGRREVVCQPTGSGNDYRCRVGDQDLSRVVLFNGGGRATPDASAELKAAEQQARFERAGIWSGRDDDDDD
jgi:penicillin-binding protein 1A